jgi:uncharacterized protein YndB with AHSA1/START domain
MTNKGEFSNAESGATLNQYYDRTGDLVHWSWDFEGEGRPFLGNLVATLVEKKRVKDDTRYTQYFVLESGEAIRGFDDGWSVVHRPLAQYYGECDCDE